MYKNSRIRYHLLSSKYMGQTVGTSKDFLFLGFVCPFGPCSVKWLLDVVDERMCGGERGCVQI